jgi:hypothetical protein
MDLLRDLYTCLSLDWMRLMQRTPRGAAWVHIGAVDKISAANRRTPDLPRIACAWYWLTSELGPLSPDNSASDIEGRHSSCPSAAASSIRALT